MNNNNIASPKIEPWMRALAQDFTIIHAKNTRMEDMEEELAQCIATAVAKNRPAHEAVKPLVDMI